ncbi:MAG: UDP-N-acetylglucosamine 2-epimerase (non-hydrolyzing) [Cryomorphaceae bacterium]|nr:MAG: UDP-N-acetylglucosamine 2-epimerase (non-hydrolyzing) [Cryomorphaceae bacterium]
MKTILTITGTRPNFVKVTQFKKQVAKFPGWQVEIVHTGQHFDQNMSQVFFDQFKLVPDHFLNIEPGSPVSQMAAIMQRLEEVVVERKPIVMMVVGDVNSTLAGALVANKMGIPLAHLESGLRSNDRGMPEEINRILTDQITDFFFITESSGKEHLRKEGKPADALHMVGNTMIDTLVAFQKDIHASNILQKLSVHPEEYALMTIHRPATVDNAVRLKELVALVRWVCDRIPVVFPIHPRTTSNLAKFGLQEEFTSIPNLTLSEPMGYFDFQKLVADCRFVLTDSGGIQEETTFLRKPCLTLRPNTERPVTITEGTNVLIGNDWSRVPEAVESIMRGAFKQGSVPALWDGEASYRVLEVLARQFGD